MRRQQRPQGLRTNCAEHTSYRSRQVTLPRRPTASQRGKKIGLFRCGKDAERRIPLFAPVLISPALSSLPRHMAARRKKNNKGAELPHCTLSHLLGKSTKTVVPCRQKEALLKQLCNPNWQFGFAIFHAAARYIAAHVATSPQSAVPTKHPVFQHHVRGDRSAERCRGAKKNTTSRTGRKQCATNKEMT